MHSKVGGDGTAASPQQTPILVDRSGSIAWITLNRPGQCNALSVELNRTLTEACRSLSPEVGVVVLRGAGRHFCAGSDLRDLHRVSREEAARVMQIEIDACHALAALPQLTIAILHGKCIGGGAILPLYCDLRIGRMGVEFSLPEVGLGWAPPYGIERMESIFHRSFIIDLLLSGRACGDREALDRGWIDRLIGSEPADELPFLQQLADGPAGVRRDLLGLLSAKDLERMRRWDREALAVFLSHFDTPRARARIDAFIKKSGISR